MEGFGVVGKNSHSQRWMLKIGIHRRVMGKKNAYKIQSLKFVVFEEFVFDQEESDS